jgi:uncharacterized protein (TIGR02285 family)
MNTAVVWRSIASYALLLVLLHLTCHQTSIQARDTITWMEVSMPPCFIQKGADANKGYGDLVAAILQKNLQEYDHVAMVTNVTRHFDRFRKGEKVCALALYPTPERQTFIEFSLPALLTLPPGLIVKKEMVGQFGDGKGRVRLQDLLDNHQMILGLSKDRSYGTSLDGVLANYRGRDNLVLYTGQELSENYFQMLLRNRVDALLGLPDEAMYHAEKMGIRDQIAIVLIEENQHSSDGWFCAVGCAKTDWGRAVIDKINAILVRERPTEGYRQLYERWLDANSLERYRRIYQDDFLRTTAP